MNKLFIVGDSTLCEYENEPDRFYPRHGYGMWIGSYFSGLKVVNLALSGRSSRSFVNEENYKILLEEMGKDDFLLIAFGHNDEKSDERHTDPTLFLEDSSSFSHWLYYYYIEKGKSVGATPILATSIVRRNPNDDYTGQSGHVTEYGDYPQAVRKLAQLYGLSLVDMTAETAKLYLDLGFDRAGLFHATNDLTQDNVDNTHLNSYGAAYIALVFARAVWSDKNCPLNKFIDVNRLIEPLFDSVITVNK